MGHYEDIIQAIRDSPTYKNHLAHCAKIKEPGGLCIECGVYKGESISRLSKLLNKETIYGFDSFEGLPEDWQVNKSLIRKKKAFTLHGKLPEVSKNIILIKGWLKDTLPEFINHHSNDKITFLNIDTDLYSSAKTILQNCNILLKPGGIIRFDELYQWKNVKHDYLYWAENEYKAMIEWIYDFNRKIEIDSNDGRYGASIKILK